jgi:hypothetical protein
VIGAKKAYFDEDSSSVLHVNLTVGWRRVIDMEWLLTVALALVAVWLAVQIIRGRI